MCVCVCMFGGRGTVVAFGCLDGGWVLNLSTFTNHVRQTGKSFRSISVGNDEEEEEEEKNKEKERTKSRTGLRCISTIIFIIRMWGRPCMDDEFGVVRQVVRS